MERVLMQTVYRQPGAADWHTWAEKTTSVQRSIENGNRCQDWFPFATVRTVEVIYNQQAQRLEPLTPNH